MRQCDGILMIVGKESDLRGGRLARSAFVWVSFVSELRTDQRAGYGAPGPAQSPNRRAENSLCHCRGPLGFNSTVARKRGFPPAMPGTSGASARGRLLEVAVEAGGIEVVPMVRAASRPWPRVLHVPRPSLAVPAVVLERKFLAADVTVSGRSIVNPVQLFRRVGHACSRLANSRLTATAVFKPQFYTGELSSAQSRHSTSACSKTSSVARACLSGGYPYRLRIRLTMTRI